jgi:Zn-dependent membrane protease YugP
MFYDPTFILVLPALLLALYAQVKVKSTFARYLQERSYVGLTGAQVAFAR